MEKVDVEALNIVDDSDKLFLICCEVNNSNNLELATRGK